MYSVSLGTVLTRIRQRCNLQNVTQFVPDAELTDMFNQSFAEWYDLVRLSTFGGQYYRSKYDIITTGGVDVYALPDDFLSSISVDVFITPDGSSVRSARRFQEEERNMFRNSALSGWSSSIPIYYDLQGPNIVFAPAPQSASQVRLNYVPTAPTLVSASGDAFDSINGWDEWIVLDCAIKVLQKANKPERIAQLQPQLQRQQMRIAAAAPQRDMYGTERVHDVYADDIEIF